MSYCFNLDCPQPQNPNNANICQSCGTSLWLQDRYRAIQLLGQGMKSRTFQGLDKNQSPPISRVIKQFHKWDLSQTQVLITCFQEFDNNPSIPQLMDAFEQEHCFYWVQEWIEGDNLVEQVAQTGVFSVDRVWQLLADVLPVLQFIHDHHFLHRDIQPAHIITTEARFMLVNWGSLGKVTDRDFNKTAIGSPEYAAPEQLNGQATFASDLYSLGVSCLYLLTAMRPFDLMDRLNHGWIWRSYWLVDEEAGINQSRASRLEQILNRLIAFSLSDRYTAAAEVLRVMGYNSRATQPSISKPTVSWQCSAILEGHQGLFASVNAVAFSPIPPLSPREINSAASSDSPLSKGGEGGILASGSGDRTVRLWHPETGESLGVLTGHTHAVKSLAFSPQQQTLVSGGTDGTMHLWDLASGQSIYSWRGHEQAVNSLAFSPSGEFLASGSADKTIKLWHPQQGELVATLSGHRLAVTDIAFSPIDSLLASASQDRSVKIWDLQRLQPLYTLTGHTWTVQAIAFSPDGSLLASGGDDNTIRLWDVASGQLIRTLSSHSWSVVALEFIPSYPITSASDFWLISVSWDKTLKVWQVSTGQPITVLTGHTDSVSALAINPMLKDNSQVCIASGSQDKTVRLWHLNKVTG